jgi:hypothetical protein
MFVKENFNVIQRVNEMGVSVLLVEQNVKQTLAIAHRGLRSVRAAVAQGAQKNCATMTKCARHTSVSSGRHLPPTAKLDSVQLAGHPEVEHDQRPVMRRPARDSSVEYSKALVFEPGITASGPRVNL